jgi:hypothetical protein
VPFGFPRRLPENTRAHNQKELIKKRVFPSIRWADLALPPSFDIAHEISRTLLTLRCDDRNEPKDMACMPDIPQEIPDPE